MTLVAELGIPAALLLISVIGWLTLKILRASLKADSRFERSMALGSLGGVSALLCHGLADFNLYIPANALVLSVLLGLGYAMAGGVPRAAQMSRRSGFGRHMRTQASSRNREIAVEVPEDSGVGEKVSLSRSS